MHKYEYFALFRVPMDTSGECDLICNLNTFVYQYKKQYHNEILNTWIESSSWIKLHSLILITQLNLSRIFLPLL